ncbi:hypothetical protein CMUS01_12089 [Colletotrichum musicola]|uniref:Cytochrome P450 n=1 Tax=Colletotrichum musicola TaxID=2175873 RepID=A0A8H6JRL5_9PEZI|nr:hypothetical protein CMUS01_12089 [Colletotrichum musicola]
MEQVSPATARVYQILLLLALALSLLFLGVARLWTRLRRSELRLPPQPPGKPILGHLPELIRENRARRWHLKLNEWAREYGPIFGVQTGYIVDYYINSDHMVKSQRKVIQQLLTSVQQADKIIPLIEYETLKFLRDNVCDPNGGLSGTRPYREIGRYTYSAFATAIMGMDVRPRFPVLMRPTSDTFPGSNIIDLVPGLGRLPLCLKPWEKKGRARYCRDLEWSMKRLMAIEKRMDGGDSSLSETFLGAVLGHEDLRGMSGAEEVAVLSLALIVAAADTSRMTTWAFLEAMMMFSDVQAKAQKEIDRVVGDRIPAYDDHARIPYIRMMMKEVWRWRPPVALGHPHITSRDMQVGQYHLPKGSRLHINAYAIGHDPARHTEPERFWPERYEDDNTTTMESINSQDPTKRDHFAFGAGRRVCESSPNHISSIL